jgi:hypothetical protein
VLQAGIRTNCELTAVLGNVLFRPSLEVPLITGSRKSFKVDICFTQVAPADCGSIWPWRRAEESFTIMRIAGHSSITVSQRYVHPSPESVERAFEKLEVSNKPPRRKGPGIELGIGSKNGVLQNRRKAIK